MLNLTDHRLALPLDHSQHAGSTIEVFAREISLDDGVRRPLLVFLQGGPGQESPRPQERPAKPEWLAPALKDYRVLMLDQRGTGLSTPFGRRVLSELGSAQNAADYLTHFRADAIVQDAEHFRRHLGEEKVSLLGQSFGGFCSLHYLTVAPDSLNEVYFTGGIPPIGRHCDDVYEATYRTQRTKAAEFYQRFPYARAQMERAVALSEAGEIVLADGSALSPGLLRSVGANLGFTGGGETIAFLLERDPLSPAFAADAAALFPFKGRNPLYAVIHESSYADGCVTNWSCERLLPTDFASDPTLFTSEHIFGWHFQDDSGLAPYREVAEILAQHEWPRLYDADVLASVDVPCAAAVFTTDPFVNLEFSRDTAAMLPGLRTWETADHDHNALRVDGGVILDRLFDLVRS